MADIEKYTFGGISFAKGQYKVRVGQGQYENRIKSMVKAGHTEILLVNFDTPQTKAQICQALLKLPEFQAWASIIQGTYEKKTAAPKAPRAKKDVVAKETKPKKVKAEKPAKTTKEPKAKKPVAEKVSAKDAEEFDIEELRQYIA